MAVDPDKPFNREEMYLAKAAGEGTTVPDEPWSRKEAYLEKICGTLDGMDEKIAALATDISLKGGVADYDHLPTDAAIGDAYITEDTGILYVWVGDEWTPLNMQGGGGIKTLTVDDYNYPTSGTKDSIAIWLLSPGIYQIPVGVTWRWRRSDTVSAYSCMVLVGEQSNINNTPIIWFVNGEVRGGVIRNGDLQAQTGAQSNAGYMLTSADVKDDITNSQAQYWTNVPLSAKQGYLLSQKAIGTTQSKIITTADWTALASSDPYDYSATVTLTATIGANSTVELINDQAVLFGTHGFAIGSVSGQNVTIYSIGEPSASVTLKINVKG